MVNRHDVVTFHDPPVPPVPPGESPWVPGAAPAHDVAVVEPDPAWPRRYDDLAARVRAALGARVIVLTHVGSTAVPGLPAKAIIDIDLVLADPADEAAYVPALEAAGFELRVREPWWFEHRLLRTVEPACHLHVFGLDSPEPVRHRIFRDWLRANTTDRELYARAKRAASDAARAADEQMMQYNARK